MAYDEKDAYENIKEIVVGCSSDLINGSVHIILQVNEHKFALSYERAIEFRAMLEQMEYHAEYMALVQAFFMHLGMPNDITSIVMENMHRIIMEYIAHKHKHEWGTIVQSHMQKQKSARPSDYPNVDIDPKLVDAINTILREQERRNRMGEQE